MENLNLLDIDGQAFLKLRNILDHGDNLQNLLEEIPPQYNNMDLLDKIHDQGQKSNNTPALVLLYHLGNKDVRIFEFITWLETAKIEKALLLLKNDEPLRIIQQPPPFTSIEAGSVLTLTCLATSFPSPEYQWFKDDTELLLQQDSELHIPCASIEDSGSYVCIIYSKSVRTGVLSRISSQNANVEVLSDSETDKPFCSDKMVSQASNSKRPHVSQFTKENNLHKADKTPITIIRQPKSPGKIAQGSSINLICEGKSNGLIKYQWFCNRSRIENETSSELKLLHLYPDPQTNEVRWEYQCQLSNDSDVVLSLSALVELDSSDETTAYFAEEKIALLLANENYEYLEDLRLPSCDAVTLAESLSSMDFKIFALKDLDLAGMKNAVHLFCDALKPNTYAVFYYAGHGYAQFGQTYLQPVDSRDNFLPEESLCVEYVLQCMQKKSCAVNVLLIDTCRKLPPKYKHDLVPREIFNADLKRNTIFGHSTSFLHGSHESDSESNGFFIKYLKKYLPLDRRIQDIISMVQCDFETDPVVNGLQNPSITSTLGASRKLCDPVIQRSESIFDSELHWADIKTSTYNDFTMNIGSAVSLYVELHHHMNVFCNGIDLMAYLDIGKSASLKELQDINVDVNLNSSHIKVLRNDIGKLQLELGMRNFLFKKQFLQTHKIESPLVIEVLIKHSPTNCVIMKTFPPLNIPIASMKLTRKNFSETSEINLNIIDKMHDSIDLISFEDNDFN